MRTVELDADDRARYEWQMWLGEIGQSGQARLKGSSVLVTRCGGLGGPLAYSLAAAGVGRIVIAHGGMLKPSDLNRQILMTSEWLGKPRVECAARRLRELNPRLEVDAIAQNVSNGNAEELVSGVDLAFDCAPLFEERFALNAACVKLGRPMVEAAMYGWECQVTTFVPGMTGCLACLYPEVPPRWKRQFPVIGAVSALAGQVATLEGLKVLLGMQPSLAGILMHCDTREMEFQKMRIGQRSSCPVCGGRSSSVN